MKTLVAVLGFEESIIISAVLRHKLDPGDSLVILTPKDKEDERAEMAKKRLQGFVEQAGVGRPWLRLSMMPISEHNLEEAIFELVAFLHKEATEGREVIVEVSGGLRALCLALTLASLIVVDQLKGIYTVTEHTKQLVKIPALKISPRLSSTLQELMFTILKLGAPSLEQLASALGKDLSTISRQVAKLEDLGLIRRENSHPTSVTPTILGRTLCVLSSN